VIQILLRVVPISAGVVWLKPTSRVLRSLFSRDVGARFAFRREPMTYRELCRLSFRPSDLRRASFTKLLVLWDRPLSTGRARPRCFTCIFKRSRRLSDVRASFLPGSAHSGSAVGFTSIC